MLTASRYPAAMGRADTPFGLRCPVDPRHATFTGSQRACFDSSVDLDAGGAVLRRVIGELAYELSEPRDHVIRCATCGRDVWRPWSSISFVPSGGEMLLCDFSTGFRPPEIVKVRPVVVVSKRGHNRQTCIVVPASTVSPRSHQAFAVPLNAAKYPFLDRSTWAKCTMPMTVSVHRLFSFRDSSTGRNIDSRRATIASDDLEQIRCMAARVLGASMPA